MWISPNHPNPPRPSDAPQDDGQALAALPRSDGREELRVTLKSFEGRPYVAVRVWQRDERGRFWPVKGKGVSVRMGELAAVVAALQSAIRAEGERDCPAQPPRHERQDRRQAAPAEHDDRPLFVERGRPVRPPWDPGGMPKLEGRAGEFNEFGEG